MNRAHVDESYVQEVLRALPLGLTPERFNALVEKDLNAGYVREVTEARRRYFGRKGAVDNSKTA